MIRTGLEKLDEILGGGIRNCTILDIFGASSTGKTQLALQIAVNSLQVGGKIFYQDTTGAFRPERLLDLIRSKGLDPNLLNNVTVGRITNISEQFKNITKITESDFSLIIIDNVTDLFSYEYPKEDQMREKTSQFAKYMAGLAKVAADKKIPIIVVNMVRKYGENEQENLEPIISLFTHIRIKLSKNSFYEGQVIMAPLKVSQFKFKITKEGLVDMSEAI